LASDRLLRKAIALDPRLADALYNLGMRTGRPARRTGAIDYISQAIQLQSGRADWQCNLGDLLGAQAAAGRSGGVHEAALEVRFRRRPPPTMAAPGRCSSSDARRRRTRTFAKRSSCKPDKAHLHSDWLLSLHYWRGAEPLL